MTELVRVEKGRKEILRNLLEKYEYEFSQYDRGMEINDLGLFGYDYLDNYWTEENRWAYFIMADGRLAGFVMVNDYPEDKSRETDFSMAEFFVMHKYRRLGVGTQAAIKAFDLHRGRWQLRRHPCNQPSVGFWDRVVSDYTGGSFECAKGHLNCLYGDGTPADVFYFDNSNREEVPCSVN